MNRLTYLIGIISSIALAYFVYKSGRDVYSAGRAGQSEAFVTINAAIYLFAFFGYAILTDVLGLIRVKTKTVKVFSLIGIVLSLLMVGLDASILNNPVGLNFIDTGIWFLPYAVFMLCSSIIGLVHSIRMKK